MFDECRLDDTTNALIVLHGRLDHASYRALLELFGRRRQGPPDVIAVEARYQLSLAQYHPGLPLHVKPAAAPPAPGGPLGPCRSAADARALAAGHLRVDEDAVRLRLELDPEPMLIAWAPDAPARPVPASADQPEIEILPPAAPLPPVPAGTTPSVVLRWFESALGASVPERDGSLATAREAAEAVARKAKSDNTRRAYRAAVRAWCAWCTRHALICLPASADDVVAFLADERGRGLSVTTIDLRRTAIRYLHFLAECPIPTAEASVAETVAGIHRDAAEQGDQPVKKLAATIEILTQILAPIGDDLAGLRDRALLLLGFAGALRRAELAAIQVKHLDFGTRGLRLTLPLSKGDREGKGTIVAIPYGTTALCPLRALQRWQAAAGIADGPVFRRVWLPPGRDGARQAIGDEAIDPRTVARIVQARAGAAGFDAASLGGHSLKRGAMTSGMERGVHPTRLKRLGRHKSYQVMDEYLEQGDPFEGHPLNGLL